MTGKEKCYEMKRLREKIAKENDIPGFEFRECDFNGECEGYCPACDNEAMQLLELINEKNKRNCENSSIKHPPNDGFTKIPPLSGKVVPPRENSPTIQPPIVTQGIIIPRNEQFYRELQEKSPETRNKKEPLMKKGVVKMPKGYNKKTIEDKEKHPRGIFGFTKKNKPKK